MKESKRGICFVLIFITLIMSACGIRGNTDKLESTQPASTIPNTSALALPEPTNLEETGNTFEEAIEEALNQNQNNYLVGEYFSSSYQILHTNEDTNGITLYLLATHGWYNRETGSDQISGCGVIAGVLKLKYENDEYSVDEYNEYEIKELDYSAEEIFPPHIKNDVLANTYEYYLKLKEVEQKKAIDYFDIQG